MLISKGKFLSYQTLFYNKICNTPYKIQLEVTTISDTDRGFIESFVGDSERSTTLTEFRALYEKDISSKTREKYGISQEVNGIVYLSPKQLVPIYGDYHLDWKRVNVKFAGRTQVIEKVVYLEEFKEYGTCIGVQIFVKDLIKGG